MDYLAFGFSDGVGSRSSLSLQNGEQPIERARMHVRVRLHVPCRSIFAQFRAGRQYECDEHFEATRQQVCVVTCEAQRAA